MSRTFNGAAGVVVALVLTTGAALGQTQTTNHTTVALSGQPAPGTGPGVVFGAGQAPVINNAGQVAFRRALAGTGVVAGNDSGVWVGHPGGLQLLAREGSAAAGAGAGVVHGFVGTPLPGNAGLWAFEGGLAGAGVAADNDRAIWSGTVGALQLVVREGAAAPGTGGTIDGGPVLLARNGGGLLGFGSNLAGAPTGSDAAWWTGVAGSVQLLVREGDATPGAGAGYSMSGVTGMALNAAGQVAYTAVLIGPGPPGDTATSVWVGSPGAVQMAARRGNAAPGTAAGVTFDSIGQHVGINSAGQVVFSGVLAGTGVTSANNTGIWAGTPGGVQLVARAGDVAPGAGGAAVFTTLYVDPAINNAGQVAFLAQVSGPGVTSLNDLGIWVGTPGGLQLVARDGQAAPGAVAGMNWLELAAPALNDAGQVAFLARLTGSGVTANNDNGIYTVGNGDRLMVAWEGNLIGGKTVASLSLAVPDGGGDGRPSALNNAGQVAYQADFIDGTSGVFLWTPDLVWKPSASGNWNTAANWTLGLNPSAVHKVTINNAGGGTITVGGPGPSATVAQLDLGTGGTGNVVLQLAGGTSLTVAPNLQGNGVLSIGSRGSIATTGTGFVFVNADIDLTGGTRNMHVVGGTKLFLTGQIGNGQIHKTGSGWLVLNLFGGFPGGINVGSGGFGGIGSVGGGVSVGPGGILAPGESPGILSVGSLDMVAGATLEMELSGTTAGTQYDRLVVTGGTVNLGGATLDAIVGGGWIAGATDKLFIIDNQGVAPVVGTFAGLADGDFLIVGGQMLFIHYNADIVSGNLFGGNDVALSPIPEPTGVATTAIAIAAAVGLVLRRRHRRD